MVESFGCLIIFYIGLKCHFNYFVLYIYIYIYIYDFFFVFFLYVPDEGSLLPKYRDCTTSNDFESYLMCCGVMLL